MIDIVVLSYSANDELKRITENFMDSLFESEENSESLFNVYVLESQEDVNWDHYPNTSTHMPPKPYGFHKYMNYGRKLGSSEYVCLCNNDLIFHKKWASSIINESNRFRTEVLSFSPLCTYTQPLYGINPNSGILFGYTVRKEISGWCIFQKRKIYEIIGDLDERYNHWFSDNDYSLTLLYYGIQHCLVTESIVDHHDKNLGKTSTDVLSSDELKKATGGQELIINKWKDSRIGGKWNPNWSPNNIN